MACDNVLLQAVLRYNKIKQIYGFRKPFFCSEQNESDPLLALFLTVLSLQIHGEEWKYMKLKRAGAYELCLLPSELQNR